MSQKLKKLPKTVWVFKPSTMARLNANAHSLGSLSGLDQPLQYHIVFKRSFVFFVLSHLSYCLSTCIALFVFILHFSCFLASTGVTRKYYPEWNCVGKRFSFAINYFSLIVLIQRARISARWTFFLLRAKNLMESLLGLHQIWHLAPIFFSWTWTKVNIQIGLKI